MARNRALSLLLVLGFVAGIRAVAPTPGERAPWLYLVALPIGYGHLIGGLWFARARLRERVPEDLPAGLVAASALVGVANLLAAYTWALHVPALLPWVIVPMLGVSAWHIVENDLALGEAQRRGLALGAAQAGAAHRVLALVAAVLVGAAAWLTPEGSFLASAWLGAAPPALAPFSIDELATAVLMYHAVSWLCFFWERGRRLARRDRRAAARLRRRLVALHTVPLALNALLYFFAPAIYVYVAAPGLYLFWSVLHAFQTAWVRSTRAPAALPAAA
jgi:hypothetical protein